MNAPAGAASDRDQPRRVAVVGASLAGVRTAKALRRRGYDGELVLIGDEAHLPYDRPPLSKQLLAGDWDPDRIRLEREDFFEDLELRLGRRATRLRPRERTVELDDGSAVRADHVVVATGAQPRRLPGTEGLDGVHVLRTLDHSLALRERLDDQVRLVVVGAGFIGSEVAATAHGRGAQVTVIEALPVPLARGVGPVVGRALARLHRERDVDLRLGTGVAAIEGDGHVEAVRLTDGTRVPADVVVVGIGVVPTTGWLEDSGLQLDDGVVCDDRCRAVGGGGQVWAAGDVARWPSRRFGEHLRLEHWTNASEQANALAANLLETEGASPYDPVPFVWSDQYDAKIQVLGHVSGEDDVTFVNGGPDEERFVAAFTRGGRLRGVVGLSWPRVLMSYRPLVAEGASEEQVLEHARTVD